MIIHRISSDFFYDQPNWLKNFRSGSINSTFPWKTNSKFIGLEVFGFPIDLQNNYQPLDGTRVIVHNTDEFPFRTGKHVHHRIGETIDILYSPLLSIIDENLKSWRPEKRNCFLRHEKKLKYFKIYTRINCEHECLSEAMLQACGCIPFYMIRKSAGSQLLRNKCKSFFEGSPDDRICGVTERRCFSMLEIEFDVTNCDCLKPCEELSYLLNIDHHRIAWAFLKVLNVEASIRCFLEFTLHLAYGLLRLFFIQRSSTGLSMSQIF